MLILERGIDERLVIGTGEDKIEVMVARIGRRKGHPVVRLGITAPPWVAVDRSEIRERKEPNP